MKQTIYVDVLVATNIFINYFLLLAVSKFLRVTYKRLRLIAASTLGALYSLIILLPQMNPWLSLFVKLVMSVTIVLLAFKRTSIKMFLRELVCFYLTSFAFAGLMLAAWYFFAPQGMAMKNSIVYFNISPLLLIVATVVCYAVLRLINRITGQQAVKNTFCRLTITKNEISVTCSAKVDTGSSLTEPFSHFPVVVAEYQSIEKIVPEQIKQCMKNTVNYDDSAGQLGGFRLVPFHALSGEGVLPAFQPDKIILHTTKNTIETKQVYIAVFSGKLAGGAFDALLNPELFTQVEQTSVVGQKVS
ncbi:MAG TPA: sigma-E processing peptidase SpoIIGA [Oscillospiraceae bacterium]|nr:sigma-E processing peptidase SpoIIGA [Oscillospiraceae bacterium]